MAIYKLSDVVSFTRGNCTFQKKDLLSCGDFIALHYGKTYKLDIINDNFKYFVGKKFVKENQIISKNDTILITTSETVEDLGKAVFFNATKSGLLGGEQIKVFPSEANLINKHYLFYWMKKNRKVFKRFATGVKVFRIKGNDFSFIEMDLPLLKEQQQIIDIIEPLEKINESIKKIREDVELLISNLPIISNIPFSNVGSIKKESKRNIRQVSAKVLNKKTTYISSLEEIGRYKTNSFYTEEGVIVINTIRTYLKKFGIIYNECDSNGTLIHLRAKEEYYTSVLKTLLSEDFWIEATSLSKGTKMPVLSSKDFQRINVKIVKEIPEIKKFLITISKVQNTVDLIKNKIIMLLI